MSYSQINSKGVKYYLHHRLQPLKGGHTEDLYFFAKKISEKGTPVDAIPEGRQVKENPKTGLLVLQKIR